MMYVKVFEKMICVPFLRVIAKNPPNNIPVSEVMLLSFITINAKIPLKKDAGVMANIGIRRLQSPRAGERQEF
jgi:hypothetical protein